MLIWWHEDYKARGGRTWVYSCEIWNPAIFAMAIKTFRTTSCRAILSPPCVQWRSESPKDPKASYKCSVTPQGLKDGKNPTKCVMWWRKHLKVGGRKEWLGMLTTKWPHLTLHTTSNVFDVNWKVNKKRW
jgi:hypothetical protein